MRVLVISREIPPVGGGAGAVALDLARSLVRRGHHLHVITMHHGDLADTDTIDGVTVERLRVGRRDRDSAYLGSMSRFVVAARRRAKALVETSGFDLVHAHAIVPDGVAALAAGVPVVVTAHGTDVPGYDPHRYRTMHRLLAPWWRRVVARAAAITTPSHFLAGLLEPSTPATVIPNGIDLNLLESSSGPRSGFLVVSRLIERKGYDRFLTSMSQVPGRQRIDVVGDGPQRSRLEGIAAESAHEVVFHGWLEHGSPEWKSLYEQRRFFVFPSERENFPVNLLEAQLAGLVVLASDVAGTREVLGSDAVYFDEVVTPDQIAATIRRVLKQPSDELDSIGAAGTQRVRDSFGWEAIAGRYMDVFEEVTR